MSTLSEPLTCSRCGNAITTEDAFCPACGFSAAHLSAGDRFAATVAYLTIIPAVVILLIPGFRSHRFVRFHAWQSVLLWGVFFVFTAIAVAVSNVAAAIVFLLVVILASLAMLFLWIVLSIKAWRGERFELPLFGTLAERLK